MITTSVLSAPAGDRAALSGVEEGPQRRGIDLQSLFLAVAVAGAAAIAVFHHLEISAWFDEAFTYGMSTQPLSSFLEHWAWGSESNMFLYYLVMRGWLGILSTLSVAPTEVMLRTPSAIFASLSSVAVFLLGRRLFGPVAGLVASGLYTANFLQILLAQTARSYSLEFLLLGISWLFLFDALQRNGRASWAKYVAASVLAVYSALFAGLVLIAQVTAVAAMLVLPGPWRTRARSSVRSFAISIALTFVLVVPIGIDAVIHGGPVWVPPAHLSSLIDLALLLSGNSHLYELAVVGGVCLALVLVLAARTIQLQRFTRCTPEDLGPMVALTLWVAVPIAVSFVLTLPGLNLHLFFPRYLGVIVAPLSLLAGAAVSALPWRALQVCAALALLGVAAPPFSSYFKYAQVQDFKDPAAWVEQRYQPGDGIVCDPAVQCAIPMAYYFQLEDGPAHLGPDSPGGFSWPQNASVPVTFTVVRSYEAGHHRIFLIFGPLAKETALERQDSQIRGQLLADGYELVDQFTSHGSAVDETVYLFETSE